MSALHRHHGTCPPQGPGHFSADGDRWFDERTHRWLPRMPGQDTLVIELEDVAPPDGLGRMLARAGHPHGRGASRFTGHAWSVDPRWPTYEVSGTAFPRVHPRPGSPLLPQAWPVAMTEALAALRVRLEAEGWRPVGCGGQPWAHRFVRPCVDWRSASLPDLQEERTAASAPVPDGALAA